MTANSNHMVLDSRGFASFSREFASKKSWDPVGIAHRYRPLPTASRARESRAGASAA